MRQLQRLLRSMVNIQVHSSLSSDGKGCARKKRVSLSKAKLGAFVLLAVIHFSRAIAAYVDISCFNIYIFTDFPCRAKTGECDKNAEYMKLYCSKSCNFCGPGMYNSCVIYLVICSLLVFYIHLNLCEYH